MNQVVVPQFLDVEDKIIGPVSVRQFLEMIIGAAVIFIAYKLFDFSLFITLAFIIGAVTLILAFVKINGQSFHYFILNFVVTFTRPRLKIWRKDTSIDRRKNNKKGDEHNISYTSILGSPVKSSKLSELSLIVDTGGVYQGEK